MTEPGPREPFPIDAPELISTGAEAIVARSKHLGLVWTKRLATIVDATTPANAVILFDGDGSVQSAVSMVGVLPLDTRVYVDIVPPGGNFIVGLATDELNPILFGAATLNQAFAAGTTTSATYVNLPGPPTVTITKAYLNTRLFIALTATIQSSLANTSARLAVNISGVGDGDIAQLVINPASTHLQVAGSAIFPAAVMGSVTVTGRWRRVAGGGTLTVGTDDWVSISVMEVSKT